MISDFCDSIEFLKEFNRDEDDEDRSKDLSDPSKSNLQVRFYCKVREDIITEFLEN